MQSYALCGQNIKTLVIQKLDFYHLGKSGGRKKSIVTADGKQLREKVFY